MPWAIVEEWWGHTATRMCGSCVAVVLHVKNHSSTWRVKCDGEEMDAGRVEEPHNHFIRAMRAADVALTQHT